MKKKAKIDQKLLKKQIVCLDTMLNMNREFLNEKTFDLMEGVLHLLEWVAYDVNIYVEPKVVGIKAKKE